MAREITVITVEDHPLIRDGIKYQIDAVSDMRVVAEGEAGEDVLHLVKTHRPDVLLLDLDMPQYRDGRNKAKFPVMATIRLLRESYPETAIIIISVTASPLLIEEALARGISGYFLKEDALTQSLPKAIRAAVAGSLYFSESLLKRMHSSDNGPSGKVITRRQKEILMALIDDPDLTYMQIGHRMGITEGAVKNHMAHLNQRLGVSNRTAALVEAIKRGLIVIESAPQ